VIRRSALLLALLCALDAGAQDQASETLLLDLCVDRVCDGIAVVLVRGEQVLVERDALARAGVNLEGAPILEVEGRAYVASTDINHGAHTTIDRAMLRLDVVRSPESLPPQRASFRTAAEIPHGGRDWSAFLNYAADLGARDDARSLFVDGALTRGGWSLGSDGYWLSDGGWQRGMSRLDVDQPRQLRRWSVGDQYALSPDPLGGGALLGGVGVQRAYDLDPFLVTFPQPYLSGVLEAPGTVEIYANGSLVGRRTLQAGPFSLEGLGLTPGRNDVRLLLRDPFGNTRELHGTSYYSASGLLAPGLSEYALRVGMVRASPFEDRYGDAPVLAGFWRRGLNDRITVGGRIEASESLRNGGINAAVRLPVGEFSGAIAQSSSDGARGAAFAAGYQYVAGVASLALGGRRFDRGYQRLGDDSVLPGFPQLREDAYAALGWSPRARVSLQLNWGRQRYFDAPSEHRYGISGNYSLGSRTQLLFAASRARIGAIGDTQLQFGFSHAFSRDSLNIGARHDQGGWGHGVDVSRSRPPGNGLGYDLSLNRTAGFDSGFGRAEYQGSHGRYAVNAQYFEGHAHARLLVSGAPVGVGGRLFATPPLDNGFALVRVPGLAGVQVRRENLPVGRTDAHGDLLVRDLLPYYPNRIGYDDADVPANYRSGAEEQNVAVPRNGGAVVAFDVHPLRAVAGRVMVPGVALAPSDTATLRLHGAGRTQETRVGSSGRYYLEDVAAGEYRVELQFDSGLRAECMLHVPATEAGIARLDALACPPMESK
jgi:outer membrane usher protein